MCCKHFKLGKHVILRFWFGEHEGYIKNIRLKNTILPPNIFFVKNTNAKKSGLFVHFWGGGNMLFWGEIFWGENCQPWPTSVAFPPPPQQKKTPRGGSFVGWSFFQSERKFHWHFAPRARAGGGGALVGEVITRAEWYCKTAKLRHTWKHRSHWAADGCITNISTQLGGSHREDVDLTSHLRCKKPKVLSRNCSEGSKRETGIDFFIERAFKKEGNALCWPRYQRTLHLSWRNQTIEACQGTVLLRAALVWTRRTWYKKICTTER